MRCSTSPAAAHARIGQRLQCVTWFSVEGGNVPKPFRRSQVHCQNPADLLMRASKCKVVCHPRSKTQAAVFNTKPGSACTHAFKLSLLLGHVSKHGLARGTVVSKNLPGFPCRAIPFALPWHCWDIQPCSLCLRRKMPSQSCAKCALPLYNPLLFEVALLFKQEP